MRHDKREAAIEHVTGSKMKSQAAGKMGFSTTEVGDLVVDAMANESVEA